jgi:hypothetical protein
VADPSPLPAIGKLARIFQPIGHGDWTSLVPHLEQMISIRCSNVASVRVTVWLGRQALDDLRVRLAWPGSTVSRLVKR